ncbi:MAG: Dabb family protein [Clostridia bacterium]|nr:Dabb family protein [Clostridia bacterium]
MKHYILAKFKDRSDTERLFPEIKALFERTLETEGVEKVEVYKTNSSRENRYSIMIEMTLTPQGLEAYDVSAPHKEWKAKYGDKLECKAIFDREE